MSTPQLMPGAAPIAFTLEGPAGAPVLMLSNSLGTSMDMWQQQADVLSQQYRVLRYDTRGHGASASASVASGDAFTLDELGGDVLRLLDALNIARVSFCGISMGGLIGLWLGVHAGNRLERLVVANSAAKIGTPQGWQDRAALVQAQGLNGVADGAASRWFTARFRTAAPAVVNRYVESLRHSPAAGYAACCAALAQADLRDDVARIATPTLLIAGLQDEVTTVADAHFLRQRIAGAICVELDASHLSNIEAAESFTRHLQDFMA